MTLLASVALLSAAAVDSKLTVYHLNPIAAGSLPVNMDTGDTAGDLYFYLGQFLLPVECTNITNGSRAGFDCANPERRDNSLVVTEVDLEIDTDFTVYSACNLCNGTDPFTGKSCVEGTYVCDCFSRGNGTCNSVKVGRENVTTAFANIVKPSCKAGLSKLCPFVPSNHKDPKCEACLEWHKHALGHEYNCSETELYHYCPSPDSCTPDSPDWTCWLANIVRKTGGMWYSTLGDGQCKDGDNTTCGWKVTGTKTVNETCMHESIVDIVEESSPDCFQGCGIARNESSPCWIGCFFDALLGPQARNSSEVALGGLPLEKLQEGWTRAFNGRCPLL